MGRRPLPVVVLLPVVVAVAAAALTGCGGRASASPDEAGTVVVDVRYSRFSLDEITVERGQTVRFVIRNHDPIPHELIVGDEQVQEVHERGTEAHHPERPGEVSVAAGATAETTFTFTADRSTRLLFGCHLPGHWAYGMKGTIRVV